MQKTKGETKMPVTIQKKVLEHLEKIAGDAGLDFVESRDYSNSGYIYLQSGFDTILSFYYQFNEDNIDMQWFAKGTLAKRSGSKSILDIRSNILDLPSVIQKCESLIKESAPKLENPPDILPKNDCNFFY